MSVLSIEFLISQIIQFIRIALCCDGAVVFLPTRSSPVDRKRRINFFSILKTECIYRHKPNSSREAKDLIDRYIHFYSYERIQNKTGVAPLTLRHAA